MIVAIFTGDPYFALLAGIGSFIPDLDREYIIVSRKVFRNEQYHRALFHNLLFLSGLFFVNVWLAVGAFLHSFIDSFTTAKDRGVEWLFPLSRLVKRGRYAIDAKSENDECKLVLLDQKPADRVCFLHEDSPQMTKLSDLDLKETSAVPWRRTYGPAANGQVFDRWFFFSFSYLCFVKSCICQERNKPSAFDTDHSAYVSFDGYYVGVSRWLAKKKWMGQSGIPRSFPLWRCLYGSICGIVGYSNFRLHFSS
jgi:hypothetical protein